MVYSVSQLAALAGVSQRTLRFYDKIGLLRPRRQPNGYRQYARAELARLQQILLYREAGLALTQIADILDSPGFDAHAALDGHIRRLRQRRNALDAMLATAEKTRKELEGEQTMQDHEKFEGFKQHLVAENEEQYGAEVRQRWGDKAADEGNARMMKMTAEEYAAFTALGEEVNAAIKAAMATGNPAGEAAMHAAMLHKQWLCHTWPAYNAEAHKNLAQMYVDDPRFAAYYNAIAPGATAFLRDAIFHFVGTASAK